ncbi:ferritin-like domain-containing protein [Archangium lansingense]|uniref:Ferritin-like domain-containing protein n=1 Tax=Archangium lansingense TaxID=2995310 RepID=A0ABT3ZW71_9BACT|nr:ferritin-like domain-containing protein [Archangium lansinium]MCY1073341.1 ferritin-like domain-containing protein [Archangium lansinium]
MAAMDLNRMLERLNNLIALDYDAVGAYEAAINRIDVESLRMRLREFQQDHERHIQDLSRVVVGLGGKPRTKPDAKGFILKGFTAVTSMMGNEAALQAMRGNELLTNRTYRVALDEEWSDETRAIIERNFSDEQRHLAFIEEALRNRSWEQTTVQP